MDIRSRSRHWRAGALAITILALALSMLCRASPTDAEGRATGVIVDQDAAVVPEIPVIFSRTDAKQVSGIGSPELRVLTGKLGNFEISLPSGPYEVRVEVRGFRSERRTIKVDPQHIVHLTFTLEVAHSNRAADDLQRVDEVTIPGASTPIRIKYGPPIKRLQSEEKTIYAEDSLKYCCNWSPRAIVVTYCDTTIWAWELEISKSKSVEASGYVFIDDGTNPPKHAKRAVLGFEKGELKLEMTP